MYSGFAVYSLERELSSLEKRKVLVKDKIDTCKKSGGPKNIDVTKQLEQLRLPPIPNRCGTPPEKAAKPKKKKKKKPAPLDDAAAEPAAAAKDDDGGLKLPPLSPLKPQVEEDVFSSSRPPSATSRPQSSKSVASNTSRPPSGRRCRCFNIMHDVFCRFLVSWKQGFNYSRIGLHAAPQIL